MKDGFIKIACATPELKVADCDYNSDKIFQLNTLTLVLQVQICNLSIYNYLYTNYLQL